MICKRKLKKTSAVIIHYICFAYNYITFSVVFHMLSIRALPKQVFSIWKLCTEIFPVYFYTLCFPEGPVLL